MKIVLLTQWYPPEPCSLPADIARSLQESTHDVQVLTGFPNYPTGTTYPGYKIRPWFREKIDGVRVTRVPLYPDHSKSKIKRGLNYLSFAVASTAGALLVGRPDVVLAFYPPVTVGLPGWFLSRLWRVPLVLYMMDVWPEELQAAGAVSSRFMLEAIARLAQWGYRRSDRIIVVTPGFKANLIEKGVSPQAVQTIALMVDTERYRKVEPSTELTVALGMSDRFKVMYAGNMGSAQPLDTVLDAASLLTRADNIGFILVGDGVDAARLQRRAETMKLSNVTFLGQHTPESMHSIYACADALLVLLRDDPIFRMTVPHKLLAYMASSKPIIGALSGDAAAAITDAGAGVVCHPEDPQALADAVKRLSLLSASERAVMGEKGRLAATTTYDRRRQGELIAGALQGAVSERKGRGVHPAQAAGD